jgi:hypothetical protein
VTRPPSPRGGSWPSPGEGSSRLPAHDDDWGPSTAVYSSAAAHDAARSGGSVGRALYPGSPHAPQTAADQWSPAGPRSSREQRAVRAANRRTERSVLALQQRSAERGLPWWGALLVLIGVAVVGGLIDKLASIDNQGGFNIGMVVASIVAILMVKRSHMFPVVIAPPIVYSAAALGELYLRSSGSNRRQVLIDAASNYLVYGFPAIAASSAAVLIIAGVRLISRK